MRKSVPTIKDVALAAGVSISTVSRVLNHADNVGEEIRARVCEAVNQVGYKANPIASSLKSTKRHQIATVIPTLRRNYYIDIIRTISDYFYKRNIIPIFLESNGDLETEMEIIASLERLWIDGIILVPGCCQETEEYQRYVNYLSHLEKGGVSIPVVLLESGEMFGELDSVRVDYENAFYLMTEHLLEIGRREIAYFSNSQNAPVYQAATDGVKKALKAYGIPLEKLQIRDDNYVILDGYRSAMSLFNEGYHPDGFVCANDQVAVGVLSACEERGIEVPGEAAVIGFGGIGMSAVTTPAITTMIAPRIELGMVAARLLHERIEGSTKEPQQIVMNARIAVRSSTMNSVNHDLEVRMLESYNYAHKD